MRGKFRAAGDLHDDLAEARAAERAHDDVRLPSLPIRLVLPGKEDIVAAAKPKAGRKISYAGGFAAALTLRQGASLATGDAEL